MYTVITLFYIQINTIYNIIQQKQNIIYYLYIYIYILYIIYLVFLYTVVKEQYYARVL